MLKLVLMIISLMISVILLLGLLLYFIQIAYPVFGLRVENKIRKIIKKGPVFLGTGEELEMLQKPSLNIEGPIRKRAGLLVLLFSFLMAIFNAFTAQLGLK